MICQISFDGTDSRAKGVLNIQFFETQLIRFTYIFYLFFYFINIYSFFYLVLDWIRFLVYSMSSEKIGINRGQKLWTKSDARRSSSGEESPALPIKQQINLTVNIIQLSTYLFSWVCSLMLEILPVPIVPSSKPGNVLLFTRTKIQLRFSKWNQLHGFSIENFQLL